MSLCEPIRVTRDDLNHALRELDTYIDVSPDDLLEIIARALNHALIRGAEAVPVAELMTREVITIQEHEPVLEAGRRFVAHHISILPVVDDEMKLLGIITEADLLTLAGLPHHRKSFRLHDLWDTLAGHHQHRVALSSSVAELMSAAVVTVREHDSLNLACERMKSADVKSLVVTDMENRVTGIVGRSTVIKALLSISGS